VSAGSLAVVVSTYNAPDMLRLALAGWARQTDHDFRLYIADDGSTAETRKLIERLGQDFPVPVEHIWHEDKGFRKARIHNKTLARIREDYVLLTDGDCIPPPSLIAVHRRMARRGCFVSGSRILLSRTFSERLMRGDVSLPMHAGAWIARRMRDDVNRIFPLLAPAHVSRPHARLAGIRGCHMACWRDDLVRVNGFDEGFEGWGREDSDLAARLLHAGVRRMDLRGVPVLHLWHAEASRDRLDDNDAMLRACLRERRIEAVRGLRQLEDDAHG